MDLDTVFFFFFNIYLFGCPGIYNRGMQAGRIFSCGMRTLNCGMWDLVLWPETASRPPHWERDLRLPLPSCFCFLFAPYFHCYSFFFHSCVLTYSKLFSLLFWCFFLVAALETKVFILNVLFHFEFIVDRFKEDIRTLWTCTST